MTEFQTALATECPTCGHKATHHRLTSSGNLYCVFASNGWEWSWTVPRGAYHNPFTCPVRELRRSSLPAEIGQAIRHGLTTYAEPEALELEEAA